MPFGPSQINNPTPVWAKRMFRIALYTVATANFVVDLVKEIPPDVKVLIAHYSVYLLAGVHFFSKMFGVKIPELDADNKWV